VLSSEFVRTARAAGLTSRTVILTYAFRNAMLPVVTTLGMVFSFLLGANVLVEKVFAWPGIGSYAVEALITSDFAPVQGFVLAMAILSAMTGNTEATDGFFYGGVVGICSGLGIKHYLPKKRRAGITSCNGHCKLSLTWSCLRSARYLSWSLSI